jgi:hypothetical protein
MDRLFRAAHRIKGSISIFHAPQAVARFGDLESAAQSGDRSRASAECKASRAMLDVLRSQLSEAQRAITL